MLPAWAVLGAGMGASQLPMVSWATARLPPDGRGAGVGLYNMAQQVGGAFGLTALVALAARHGAQSLHVARLAHGLRYALLLCALLAAANLLLVGALRMAGRRSPSPNQASNRDASTPHKPRRGNDI